MAVKKTGESPSSGQNLPQIVTHIMQKAFFKHALGQLTTWIYNTYPCIFLESDQ